MAPILLNPYGFGAPSGPTYASAVLADSPLLWVRMGEAVSIPATDSSGNGRTLIASGTYTQAVTGLLPSDSDTAFSFNGGKILTASAAWMNTTGVTAECLAKPTGTGNQWLVGRDNTGATSELSWRLDIDSGKFRAVCILTATGTTYRITSSTTSVVAGTTYHVALTYDGSDLRLYVNGVENATPVSVAGTLKQTGQHINIGRSGGNILNFVGTLDEVAVYGSALSSARILAHAAAAGF